MKSSLIENAETLDYIPVKRRRNFPYNSTTRDDSLERDNSDTFTSSKEKGSSLLHKSLERSRKSPVITNSQKIAESEATLLKAVLVSSDFCNKQTSYLLSRQREVYALLQNWPVV